MSNIYDIAPKEMWEAAFAAKHINKQVHPALPLEIYDYSQVCQFERAWNPATLAARGLIVDAETKEIVSRPLGKFFNHNEPDVDQSLLTGPAVVSDKADGSMGISYRTPDGTLNISTRGSFASEQAQHATARYLELYDGKWEPAEGFTYIWEIIYPTNRIVLNYGDMDDLILIARVNIETGISEPASQVAEWKWNKVEQFQYANLAEALASSPRENAEGLVVHFLNTDTRVKIKQDDYVQLHRIITGASSRRIWEMLVSGNDFDSWLKGLPEEFIDFVERTRDNLLAEFAAVREEVENTYNSIIASLPEDFTQKDYALAVQNQDKKLVGMLFSRHSGGHYNESAEKKITDSIWKLIQPEFEKPFWNLNGKVETDDNE
jgi:RNA ligase